MTSPIFLQVEPNGVTLTIPTAFVSYTGEALDHKIPLLRSQEALGKQALRILRWFGSDTVSRVFTTIGPEQEYFLVDRRLAELRPDLILTGRTLFGAPSPKGQELEDQYFGPIRERMLAFMMDLDRELWRLGIPAKTRHNEVAPAQFELAPVFEATSVGSDHNMIVMNTDAPDRRPARPGRAPAREAVRRRQRLGQAQQLVDGHRRGREPARARATTRTTTPSSWPSWWPSSAPSTSTRTCCGPASPTPATTTAWAPTRLLRRSSRSSSASSSRTSSSSCEGGSAASSKTGGTMELGVTSLPVLPKDATDRNRTSPFAFTGNKFEFRAVGSSRPDLLAADGAQHRRGRLALASSPTSSRSSSPTTWPA